MSSLNTTMLLVASALGTAQSNPSPVIHPLRFFEGRTESSGTIKILFRKPTRTHSMGDGRIGSDGTITLVQQVDDEGKPPHQRRWRIRHAGPGRFTGTMTEASSPVRIEKVGERYRLRFESKGNLSVEQWIVPSASGMSAHYTTTVRKMGMKVAAGSGVIRRVRAADKSSTAN